MPITGFMKVRVIGRSLFALILFQRCPLSKELLLNGVSIHLVMPSSVTTGGKLVAFDYGRRLSRQWTTANHADSNFTFHDLLS